MICFFLSKDLGKKTYIFIQPRNPTTWKTAVAVNFHQLETPKTSHSCLKNGTLGFPGNQKIHENFGPRSFIILVTSDESIHLFWPSIQPPTRTKTKGYQHSSKNTRFFLVVQFFWGLNSPDSLGLISFFETRLFGLVSGKQENTQIYTHFFFWGVSKEQKFQLQEWGNIIVRSRP